MSRSKREAPANEGQTSNRTSLLVWLLRLAVFAGTIGLCLAAMVFGYVRWQDARLARLGPADGGGSHLNPVRSLYLRSYLAARAGDLSEPAGAGAAPVSFMIDPGERADQIAANLTTAGLLTDQELFLNYLRYYNLDAGLEAGQYEVSPDLTIPELAAVLSRAVDQQIDLTFLEGWRLEEMAGYLEQVRPAAIDAGNFLSLVQNSSALDLAGYEFLAGLPKGASLEGFLFPDTYRVPVEADATFLIYMMLDNFGQQVTPAMRQAYGVGGLSVYEAVTLASIVQREAVISDERPVMVGVFMNRLTRAMPLQADPTVQYAAGYQPDTGRWWKTPLTQADLELDSPYNTYRYGGLPPGPIASPGLAALQAVAEPEMSDYLYFVVDCEADIAGQHVFSTTFEEHLANVQKCR